jgi:hypothetical protein
MRKIGIRRGLVLASSGLLTAGVLLGTSALPAQASSTYTICANNGQPYDGEYYCLNSPGFGNNVVVLDAHYARYTEYYSTKWVTPWGADVDVASQQVGAGPNCLQANGSTGYVLVTTCTSSRASQQWWWDPSTHQMVNEYLTSLYYSTNGGQLVYMFALSPSSGSGVVLCNAAGWICTLGDGAIWQSNSGAGP